MAVEAGIGKQWSVMYGNGRTGAVSHGADRKEWQELHGGDGSGAAGFAWFGPGGDMMGTAWIGKAGKEIINGTHITFFR